MEDEKLECQKHSILCGVLIEQIGMHFQPREEESMLTKMQRLLQGEERVNAELRKKRRDMRMNLSKQILE